jgi:branched-chain amino acid transport system permease protein
LTAYVVVVLGGFGSMLGALAGGLVIGVVEALSGYFISPGLKEAVYLLIFIAVLVIRPTGLFGIVGSEEMGVK